MEQLKGTTATRIYKKGSKRWHLQIELSRKFEGYLDTLKINTPTCKIFIGKNYKLEFMDGLFYLNQLSINTSEILWSTKRTVNALEKIEKANYLCRRRNNRSK